MKHHMRAMAPKELDVIAGGNFAADFAFEVLASLSVIRAIEDLVQEIIDQVTERIIALF